MTRPTLQWVALFLTAGMLLLPADRSYAEATPAFKLVCPTDVCPEMERRAMLEGYVTESWNAYLALGFPSPLRKMARHSGGPGGDTINIEFCDPDDPEASGGCQGMNASALAHVQNASDCGPGRTWPDNDAVIRVRKNIESVPPPVALYIIAHEIFHAFGLRGVVAGENLCVKNQPTWVTEATAVFAGFWVVEQHFGSRGYQPSLQADPSRSLYGLRPYHYSLNTVEGDYNNGGKLEQRRFDYYSSSLWRYIAERYHDGSPAFLVDYLGQRPPKCPPGAACTGDDAWLDWLDFNLRQDAKVRQPLYLVYPDFLTQFANWAPERFGHLPPERWLKTAFDGCEAVLLDPEHPEYSVFDHQAVGYAGRCFRVQVSGLHAGERFIVKLVAEDTGSAPTAGEVDWIDATLLGVVRYGAPSEDNPKAASCYAGRKRAAVGQTACLLKPFTAEVKSEATGSGRRIRTFLTSSQQAPGNVVENIYMVSHVPPQPRDLSGDKRPHWLKLKFGLALTRLEKEGETASRNTGGHVDFDADIPLPMSFGAATGGQGAGLPELAFLLGGVQASLDRHESGFASITASNYGAGGAQSEPEFEVILTLDSPVLFGQVGTYDAKVTVTSGGRDLPDMTAGGSPEAAAATALGLFNTLTMGMKGQIEVQEFSDAALRLTFSGTMCRGSDIMKDRQCRQPQRFNGQLIRPFGWAYDVAQRPVATDSPGLRIFREMRFGTDTATIPGGANAGGGDSPAAAPAGLPGIPSVGGAPCECSCPEYQRLKGANELAGSGGLPYAEAMEARIAWSNCRLPCREPYRACRGDR